MSRSNVVRWWVSLLAVACLCGPVSACKKDSRARITAAPAREARCDDPALKVAFEKCEAATDAEGCKAAGGEWQTVGMENTETCICPTGQAGCTCTRAGECLAGCYGDPKETESPRDMCSHLTWGECASTSENFGCGCEFLASGEVDGYCAD